jgi:hypothetical protein
MIRIALLLVAIVGMAVWALLPIYKRWRDHLREAPELQDTDWRTRVRVMFSGMRTKMLARLTEGLGLASVAVNAAGEYLGVGGIDLSAILPAIPLGAGKLEASQYAPLGLIALGRLVDWLRNRTTTAAGQVDPALAVAVASNSEHVEGSRPSPALASVTDLASSAEGVRVIERGPRRKGRR